MADNLADLFAVVPVGTLSLRKSDDPPMKLFSVKKETVACEEEIRRESGEMPPLPKEIHIACSIFRRVCGDLREPCSLHGTAGDIHAPSCSPSAEKEIIRKKDWIPRTFLWLPCKNVIKTASFSRFIAALA